MDCFEFVSASASTRDAATGDSKPNCQKTCSASGVADCADFCLRQRLSRATVPHLSARPVFQRVEHFIQVFVPVNNFLQISLPVSTSTNTVFSGPYFSGGRHPIEVFATVNNFRKFLCSLRL
jgi:hypothetical protein